MRITILLIIFLFSCKSNESDKTAIPQPQLFKCGINQVAIYDMKTYRCSIKNEGKFVLADVTELEYYFSHQSDSLGVLYLKFQNNKGSGKFIIQEGHIEYHPNRRYVIKNEGNIELKVEGNTFVGNFNGIFKNYLNQEKEFSGNFEIEKQ
ncbi:MAG: hypothetical protein IPH28_08395 [Cytophagaceae bacterium]|nr:hypothetical protein [Cytophagaceae bacterium]MBK9511896.1 hypothetical protein [Cytophagaceae bacterium]MBK9934537.1 hypothetical protein [Cytophagaceae bacterium]MBL0300987.1 hypothetical protein [Cytophagaceae bacterium]MBL0323798.1 hypothetical protein [Cytophagaceae bacterium]